MGYYVKAEVVGRGGEWERDGEAEVVGSKLGLGQIPPAAHLTKLY
jgi:hypothetical protein